jgi:hypothetical protein
MATVETPIPAIPANGKDPVSALLRLWPIILATISITIGWATMHGKIDYLEERAEAAEHRIVKLEESRDEDRKALDQNLEGIRNALGRQQLTLARICVILSPKGRECD